MTFGLRINNERKKLGVSQEKLAEILNVSRVTISKWERGETKPNKENIDSLENYFGIKLFNEDNSFDNKFVIGTTHIIADYKLAKIVLKFEELNLGIKVKIKMADAVELNDSLINDRINILIDYYPQINFANGRFIFKAIGKFKTCFACNESSYEKFKNIKRLEDLNKCNLILPDDSRRRQLLDNFLKEENILLKEKTLAHNSKYMADVVLNSDYVGYFIEEQAEYFKLHKLPLEEVLPFNPIGMVYLRNASYETKIFADLVLKYF